MVENAWCSSVSTCKKEADSAMRFSGGSQDWFNLELPNQEPFASRIDFGIAIQWNIITKLANSAIELFSWPYGQQFGS